MFGAYADALPGVAGVVEGGQTSTGSVVRWFKALCGGETNDGFYDEMNEAALRVPPGCEGLVVQEHLQGNRTPHVDPNSRGALVGLTLKHGRAHVYRAILEGISFGTRLIFDSMADAGYVPESVTVAGGATNSELWMQIHADVAGVPFKRTRCADAPALGCAGAGRRRRRRARADVPAAVAAMVHGAGVVTPDADAHAAYAAAYAAYKATYHATKRVVRGAARSGAKTRPRKDAATDLPVGAKPLSFPRPARVARNRWNRARGERKGKGGLRAIVALAPGRGPGQPRVRGGARWRTARTGSTWTSWTAGFVPNLTIGPPVVAHLRTQCAAGAFLDCHLSCADPGALVEPLAAAGASSVTFHWEAVGGDAAAARALAAKIRRLGMRAAIALKPSTPAEGVAALAEDGELDMVLCLSVEPGFGGQSFMPSVLPKIAALRARCPRLDIQVDGGGQRAHRPLGRARRSQRVLVAGSAVFGASDPAAHRRPPRGGSQSAVGNGEPVGDSRGEEERFYFKKRVIVSDASSPRVPKVATLSYESRRYPMAHRRYVFYVVAILHPPPSPLEDTRGDPQTRALSAPRAVRARASAGSSRASTSVASRSIPSAQHVTAAFVAREPPRPRILRERVFVFSVRLVSRFLVSRFSSGASSAANSASRVRAAGWCAR